MIIFNNLGGLEADLLGGSGGGGAAPVGKNGTTPFETTTFYIFLK